MIRTGNDRMPLYRDLFRRSANVCNLQSENGTAAARAAVFAAPAAHPEILQHPSSSTAPALDGQGKGPRNMAQNKGIGLKEVAHMAELSRLTVSEEEQTLFARQLDDILGYMDVLAKVDTSEVEPLYSPAQHRPAPREDVAAHVCTRQDVLANAPEADGEYFMVPRIV